MITMNLVTAIILIFRVLAEEWERREELERLQEEQNRMLEEERLKRKQFEMLQAEKEAQFRGNFNKVNITTSQLSLNILK